MDVPVRFARSALAGVAIAALALPAVGRAEPAGPGCRPAQPAVAHHPGGVVVDPQPPAAPVPCGVHTGFAGGESAIAVARSGAVFYAPAVQATAGVQAQY